MGGASSGPALAGLRAGLYRTLARDDARVAYWVRHVRIGVLVTELAAAAVIGYVLLTAEPTRETAALLALAGIVVVCTPAVLLLPLRAMMRDWRGPTLFYGWTLATAVVVITATRLDGGATSPLDALLFLTLTYLAVAYPPQGVVAMGTLMTVAYLLLVELPGLTTGGLFFVAVMGIFTIVCAMSSANSWAGYDRQVLLISAQEALASTDALTGIPNRRLFLERLAGAVRAAGQGHPAVVCLVDLDGFKAVNDTGGHAAGDALLTAIGSALGGAVRETDTVARLGGDEFAVLAAVTDDLSPALLAERLRAAVAATGARYGVTASVGLAAIEPGDAVEELLHRADVAMYRAKTGGGDRVSARGG
ncbi:diguanylate cyclase (GGDEF)-like protein [Blastococcus xanthinilyticus]|uniref:Diguanylate cyclase (GGDEF)-like protein n=1 Tax=Blastococcus xanthinilyticus TaxID=1564164 RepID=A0A5S5CZV3_9ACTN|nr:diguanylate cyclase (GGDEF)-like protein [Blastococcus xanthinilyticus]